LSATSIRAVVPMLAIRNLTKSYPDSSGTRSARILDRIDLDVPENQFLCILGASGCGKTTLLRILSGLTRADNGAVEIGGQRVDRPGQDCSMVFQNYGLCQRRSNDASVGRSKNASVELTRRPPAGSLLAFRRYALRSPVGWRPASV